MWLQILHQYLRKVVPFFYIRNWYTGQFEFSKPRFVYTSLAVLVVATLVLIAWWLGRPIEYSHLP
jgi:hypothetical protein